MRLLRGLNTRGFKQKFLGKGLKILGKEMKDLNHSDCRNFIPVDVAKGICQLKNKQVLIDTPVCERFVQLPKCKFCSNFTVNQKEKTLGTCEAGKDKPWTYADLPAVNCEMFK